MLVTKLSATPAVICTSDGVTITCCGNWIAAEYQRLMNPSGQQYCEGHCGVLVIRLVIGLLHHPRLVFRRQQ